MTTLTTLRYVLRSRAVALSLAVASTATFASSVVSESVEQMTVSSSIVVRGRVIDSAVNWDASKSRIWTWTRISVEESLKGSAKGTITVKQPGGQIGDVVESVDGAARFVPGEEVVVFLEQARDEPGTFIVRALGAGKVKLVGSRVIRNLDGLNLVEPNAQQAAAHIVGCAQCAVDTRETFLARVRKAARDQ